MAIYKASNGETYEILKVHDEPVYERMENNHQEIVRDIAPQVGWLIRFCGEPTVREISIKEAPTVDEVYKIIENYNTEK